MHSEAYREAQRASLEEALHQNNHCLLSYWNTGNHLHRLRSVYIIGLLSMLYIGVGNKFEVQRPCCAVRSIAKKIESNFAAAANFLKVCTFRLQNKVFFQRCMYNLLASFSDLTNPPIFNLCGEEIILTSSSFPGDRPASF